MSMAGTFKNSHMKNFLHPLYCILLAAGLMPPTDLFAQTQPQPQAWRARLAIPDTDKAVEFDLEFDKQNKDRIGRSRPLGTVVNGEERIRIPSLDFRNDYLTLRFPEYESGIQTNLARQEFLIGELSKDTIIRGEYRKRRGDEKWALMKFSARQGQPIQGEQPEAFLGRWSVKFESSDDSAVGIFKRAADSNRVHGTFLTTTGDYRYLGGYVKDKTLVLCCFDGAHAFRFEAKVKQPGTLTGEFWSSDSWHETWTATKDDNAQLPDAFKQTTIKMPSGFDDLKFPDLKGTKRSLNDIAYRGKARLIYVFGSWCPNCHDAAKYFKELQEKYGDRGLKILGLAFELTSNNQRNAQQIKRYLRMHGVRYPVLIAGPADKAEASKKFPVLDKIRSYPTTIFVDGDGEVHGVHTGFSGPATGESYEELKKKFESIIEKMLEK